MYRRSACSLLTVPPVCVLYHGTEDLRRQAQVFQKQAVTLQRKTWWQQFRVG